MKTAKYKLAVLATAVSFSLFSAGSYAKDGEMPTRHPSDFDASKVGTKNFWGKEIKVGNQCIDGDGVAGECRNNALDYLYDKIKDFSPEQITAAKNEAINAVQNAANKAEADVNASTDKKITGVKNELKNAINNAKNDAVSAGKTAADTAEKNANSYTDKKVSGSNTRTDGLISQEQQARTNALSAEKVAREQGNANTLTSANQYTDKKVSESNARTDNLISKEQKARTDALNTEKTVREQADINTLKNANQYTDLKIRENNELLSADIEQARSDFDNNLKTTKSTLENNISDVNQSLTNSVNRAKKYLSDNLEKTRHDLSANIIASQNDSDLRTDRLINKEQKDRTDALSAEKRAREQGDVTTLNNANKYTDYRIRSLGSDVSDALNDFQQKTEQKFAHFDNKIDRVEKRANAGIAGVTAISSIPYVNSERFSFGMAMGHYRDAQAIATGMQYKPTANTNVRLNASWNNGGDTNIGAGFAVGWAGSR